MHEDGGARDDAAAARDEAAAARDEAAVARVFRPAMSDAAVARVFRPAIRRPIWPVVLLALAFATSALVAQYQKAPPDFGGVYTFPTPTHPEPRGIVLLGLDVAMLAAGLGLAAYLVLWRRSRRGVMWLSIAAIAYFGFYRKGCTCPIGSIQNVTLSLVDPHYMISLGVIAFFLLPLIAALLFGRVFCGGVCPLGAVQDLVLLRPRQVPERLERVLRWIPYVYLAAVVYFAGWGMATVTTSGKEIVLRRFLICEWDPFIGLFRLSGPFHMIAIGAGFLLVGMVVGRPYCRWLCPYGGLLSILSRVAWKNVTITPDKELDCGLCADACPYGAIHNFRADRDNCVACARCYECCPREVERLGGEAVPIPLHSKGRDQAGQGAV